MRSIAAPPSQEDDFLGHPLVYVAGHKLPRVFEKVAPISFYATKVASFAAIGSKSTLYCF